eukprot:4067508-Pyramimonas_sp.AAC.1
MTCGLKLEHQPWRSAWKVARRRVCEKGAVKVSPAIRAIENHTMCTSHESWRRSSYAVGLVRPC